MPTKVSDTFAFACSRSDAWDIIHSDPKADLGISDDARVQALLAAQEHVAASQVELLISTWSAFANHARGLKTKTKTTRFDALLGRQPDSRTLRGGSWTKTLVTTRGKELGVGVSIEPTFDGGSYAIYGYITAPEGYLVQLESSLTPAPAYCVRDEAVLYVSEHPLVEGAAFATLAESLVADAWPVVDQASRLLSPDRGTKAKK